MGDDANEVRCRDAAVLPHPIGAVFDVLTDLATYPAWWTLVRTEPLDPARARLAPGVRFRIEGARPGGTPTSWTVEVLEVDAPRRVELAYVEGDLLGSVAWELDEVDGGTRVAYVYRAVRAGAPGSAATFARHGTRLHSVAMEVDALAGLARFLDGAPLGDEWRAEVRARMAAGVAALPAAEAG